MLLQGTHNRTCQKRFPPSDYIVSRLVGQLAYPVMLLHSNFPGTESIQLVLRQMLEI